MSNLSINRLLLNLREIVPWLVAYHMIKLEIINFKLKGGMMNQAGLAQPMDAVNQIYYTAVPSQLGKAKTPKKSSF